jgi:DNA-binding response OmpR family regulator
VDIPKILIVDDRPDISGLLHLILTRAGEFDALQENRSSAALRTAREYRPDLAILDVDMPGKSGGDVAAEFRGDPILKNVPIIFLSSLITAAEAGVRNGVLYLPKSVDRLTLIDSVRKLLHQPTL